MVAENAPRAAACPAGSGRAALSAGLSCHFLPFLIGGGVSAWACFPFACARALPSLRSCGLLGRSCPKHSAKPVPGAPHTGGQCAPACGGLCLRGAFCRSVQGEACEALDGCRVIRSRLWRLRQGRSPVLTIRPDGTGGSSREAPEGQGRRPQSRSERDGRPGHWPCRWPLWPVARPLAAIGPSLRGEGAGTAHRPSCGLSGALSADQSRAKPAKP